MAKNHLSGTVRAPAYFGPLGNEPVDNIISGELHGDGTNITNVARVASNGTNDYMLTVGASSQNLVGEPNLQFNGSRLLINGQLTASAMRLSSLAQGTATTASYLALDSNNNVVLTSSAGAGSSPGGPVNSLQFNSSGSLSGSSNISFSSNTLTVGAALNANSGITVKGAISFSSSAGVKVTGSILPSGSNTYSLGSANNRWKELFVGTGSIHLGPQCTLSSISGGVLLNKSLHVTGNLVVSGNIRAHTFDIIQTNLVEINSSGSTNFGNSTDDVHKFQGKHLQLDSGLVVKRIRISSSQAISVNNYYVGVDSFTPSASVTVTLPDAATLQNGQVYVIKDEGGKADLYNVLVKASGSQLIDSQNQVVLQSPHASLTLYCDGASRFYIG